MRYSVATDARVVAAEADGRIVELGTHAELTAVDGLYAELYELQARS